jgi:Ca2+-dependent lipid-binding protein
MSAIIINRIGMEGASDVFTKVELFLSCRSLRNLDVFSKSDPYVKVSLKRDYTQLHFSPLGQTETVQNNINPNFARSFLVDYIFESRQDLRFEVYDDDHKGSQDDFIGYAETTLGNLMGARGQTAILDLREEAG